MNPAGSPSRSVPPRWEDGADSVVVHMPAAVAKEFERVTEGGQLVEGFGLTECSPVTHANPFNGVRKAGSIGLPIPDTVRITTVDERIANRRDKLKAAFEPPVHRWKVKPSVFIPQIPPDVDMTMLDGLIVGMEDGKGNCMGLGILEYREGALRMISTVAEGAKALRLGSIRVTSDTTSGRAYRVTFHAMVGGLVHFRCSCLSGAYRWSKPIPCKHSCLAGRRLEREGLATWHDGHWWSTLEPPDNEPDPDDDPFIGIPGYVQKVAA